MISLQSALVLCLLLTKISGSTEGEDLLRIINTSLRSESLQEPEQDSSQPPTTEPPILSDQMSGELPDIAQYDSLPTKKPKFISIFAGNITFENGQNLTYYAKLLKEIIPAQHQLEYLEAISDRMRQENKFQVEEWLHEFASMFYWALDTHKNQALQPWSKKTEKKILKRFLKYAVASESFSNKTAGVDATCANLRPFNFLGKKFYQSMLSLSEEEGYEILMEILQNRNVTLTPGQLQDLQCLYYTSFQGMANGRAYIFSEFDDDWDRRNSIFGKPVILQSIRVMVQEEAGISEDSRISDFMLKIFSAFPEYRSKLEEEKKAGPKKTPRKFYQVVTKLEGKLMGVEKSDIFVDVDSKDIIMSTGVEALLDLTSDVFDPEKSPVVFDPFSRHDWNQLQKLRWAGIQIFDKYDKFFARIVKNKITEIYQGRGLSRTFSNAFHHIRLLPTGPLILQGFETLNDLMEKTPPRDKATQADRIKNFKQTLLFLRGLYSTNEGVLSSLPQQVQILTDPNLNKNLKLILKFSPVSQLGPSTSPLTPETSQYVPQNLQRPPEVSQVTPELPRITPELSYLTPQHLQRLPDVSRNTPEVSQRTSEQSQTPPHQTPSVRRTSLRHLDMSHITPELYPLPPETSTFALLRSLDVPSKYQYAPETSSLASKSSQSSPETFQVTLERSKRSPQVPPSTPLDSEFAPPPSQPAPNEDEMMFMEVGVSAGTLTLMPFPHIPMDDQAAPFVNSWQFQLGYFKGYSEAWQEPVIKAGIVLANETTGGLSYSWMEKMMTYKNPNVMEAKDTGFWDLSIFPSGQSFQLMYQGKVETFFSVKFDSTGIVPLGLKGEQQMPYNFNKNFRPAQFFVMPSDDMF